MHRELEDRGARLARLLWPRRRYTRAQEGAAEDWSYVKGVQYGWIPTDAKTYAFPDPCQ
jgi:hypothetical protein